MKITVTLSFSTKKTRRASFQPTRNKRAASMRELYREAPRLNVRSGYCLKRALAHVVTA